MRSGVEKGTRNLFSIWQVITDCLTEVTVCVDRCERLDACEGADLKLSTEQCIVHFTDFFIFFFLVLKGSCRLGICCLRSSGQKVHKTMLGK